MLNILQSFARSADGLPPDISQHFSNAAQSHMDAGAEAVFSAAPVPTIKPGF